MDGQMENVGEITHDSANLKSATLNKIMEFGARLSIDKGLDRNLINVSEAERLCHQNEAKCSSRNMNQQHESSSPVQEDNTEQELAEEQSTPQVKISGHLEKKGKMRMVSSWKKYWFVLEGRLLLYYRSRADYDMLSPCKGCITLGSPCNVKPGTTSNWVFQIETRNTTILLRADSRAEHDKWMVAILSALNHPASQLMKLSQLCYSADDLAVRGSYNEAGQSFIRQYTLPERLKNSAANRSAKNMKNHNGKGTPKTASAQSIGTGCCNDNSGNNKSPKLPKNENLAKPSLDKQGERASSNGQEQSNNPANESEVEKMRENELYSGTDPVIMSNDENSVDKNNVIIENFNYITVEEADVFQTQQQEEDRHIYQEIMADTSNGVTHGANDYALLQGADVKDQNENKVEYCEPIYASNDIYATIENNLSEPELPPRPMVSEEEANASSSSKLKKKENLVHLKLLAKMIKQQRKEGAEKKQSFMIRILKKIKREDSGKVKENNEYNEIFSASSHGAESVCGLVPNEPLTNYLNDLRTPAEQLVEELKEVLEEKKHVQTRDIGVLTSEEEIPPIVFNYDGTEPLAINVDQSYAPDTDALSVIQNEDESPAANNDAVSDIAETSQHAALSVSPASLRPESQTEPLESAPLERSMKTESEKPTATAFTVSSLTASKLRNFECDIYDATQRLYIPRPKLISKSKRHKGMPNTPDSIKPNSYSHFQNAKCYNEMMTIAQILDDLENQNYKPFSRQNVKELIEKFNDTSIDDEHNEAKNGSCPMHFLQEPSDIIALGNDLSGILDELAQGNNAPPYKTTDIKGSQFNADEAPIQVRKRRRSEPDYDVPRPHSALQILPSIQLDEEKMKPTRFFGPVIINQSNCESKRSGSSISPDSLEIDINLKLRTSLAGTEEDRSMRSYTSHIYASKDLHENTINHANKGRQTKTVQEQDKSQERINMKPCVQSSLKIANGDYDKTIYLRNYTCDYKLNSKNNASPFCGNLEETIDEGKQNSICLDSLEPGVANLKND